MQRSLAEHLALVWVACRPGCIMFTVAQSVHWNFTVLERHKVLHNLAAAADSTTVAVDVRNGVLLLFKWREWELKVMQQ
jgi:hypothetical protein